MTPAQKKMARHALGLPNNNKRSYRNRFIIRTGGTNWWTWSTMVKNGDAMRHRFEARARKGPHQWCFSLTLKGAWAAIEDNEALDREDFPGAERKVTK